MLAWLGEWLQSIVVIVLLAVVIELALPSSKMLRYTRLVIGLVLLLTMLNPIFQLFQIDFQQKLNASFEQWERDISSQQRNGSTLQKITKEAEKLQQQREGAALDMTRASLEQAMIQQLLTSSAANVKSVAVKLGWVVERNQQHPIIEQITVEIAASEERQSEYGVEVIAPIELEPISIPDISLDQSSSGKAPVPEQLENPRYNDKAQTQQNEHFNKQAQEIVTIITAGWNVNANQIFVKASN